MEERMRLTHTGRIGTYNVTAPTAMFQTECDASTTLGMLIKGASSQSANLMQLDDSSNAPLFYVKSDGKTGIGVDPTYVLDVQETVTTYVGRFTNTRNGSTGCVIETRHLSGSPANNDLISALLFTGYNNAGTPEEINYGGIYTYIDDLTDGSEDGHIDLLNMIGGTLTRGLRIQGNNIEIGAGTVGVDYTLTFDGETNDGVITWMEDEDYFKFSDDILSDAAEKHYFRDTAIGIYSQADGYMDLFADTAVRLGDSSAGAPTNYTAFEADGDILFVGGAGLQYGCVNYHGAGVNTTCTVQNTWYQITAFDNNSQSNGDVTPDHTNDHITVGKAGDYQIFIGIGGASTTAGNTFEVQVQLNNGATPLTALTVHETYGTANRVRTGSMLCFAPLSANDTVEAWVRCTSGANKVFTTDHIVLNVEQAGG
jgi:hypothetical protein